MPSVGLSVAQWVRPRGPLALESHPQACGWACAHVLVCARMSVSVAVGRLAAQKESGPCFLAGGGEGSA